MEATRSSTLKTRWRRCTSVSAGWVIRSSRSPCSNINWWTTARLTARQRPATFTWSSSSWSCVKSPCGSPGRSDRTSALWHSELLFNSVKTFHLLSLQSGHICPPPAESQVLSYAFQLKQLIPKKELFEVIVQSKQLELVRFGRCDDFLELLNCKRFTCAGLLLLFFRCTPES